MARPTSKVHSRWRAACPKPGVRAVAATPHVGRPVFAHFGREEPPPGNDPVAVRALQTAIDEADIPLLVVPGAELTFADTDWPKLSASARG
jgi:tyrosine-protein phosphatase YwqE